MPLASLMVLLCLVCSAAAAAALPAHPAAHSDRLNQASVIVNGRTLAGPNSFARRRDDTVLVPILAVARALGDTVSVVPRRRFVRIDTQDGHSTTFDGTTGIITKSGATIKIIATASEIAFGTNADQLFLPAEIAAALFAAIVTFDDDKNAVIVTRGITSDAVSDKSDGRRLADVYQIDYEYSLNRYSSAASHDLNLSADGRLGDGRFRVTANTSAQSPGSIKVRNGTFRFERPNGQRYAAGDIGTGTDLQFLSTYIRGASATVPLGAAAAVTAFGGRSYSGTSLSIFDLTTQTETWEQTRFGYDTAVAGVSAAMAPKYSRPFDMAAGALKFSGAGRSGEMLTAAGNYHDRRFNIRGDLGYGRFARADAGYSQVKAYDAAKDVSGTFQATDRLSFHGRYAHVGSNFLSPQQGMREPLSLKAAGIAWNPVKWLSTSVNASRSTRPGTTPQPNNYFSAAIGITTGARRPSIFLSHTQTETSQVKSGAFTMLNASKEFSRLRLYLNASRIKTLGPHAINARFGATYSLNDKHAFEISQGFGKRSLSGQVDWRAANLFKGWVNLSAGTGYFHGRRTGFKIYERIAATARLPRQTSIQVSYYGINTGSALLVSLRGSLFHKAEARAFLNSPVSEMNSFGRVSGRVYQDVDQNGRYDAAIDKPQADVKVRVDGNRYVLSDQNGLYHFESVTAGDHRIYIDLVSVRADLTLLDDARRSSTLLPGQRSVFDFRLVRTGRVSGQVWLDANNNGKIDEDEEPLADIRVVTDGGRDTLTDENGFFVIADLPPGEHFISLDDNAIREKMMSGSKAFAVQIFAGRETGNVELRVILTPPEVKRFGSSFGQKADEDNVNVDK